MKLHDLQVGQRFTFIGKHRGKVFEVTERGEHWIRFSDVATRESRVTDSRRLTFRMDVWLESENRVVEFTQREVDMLSDILHDYYKLLCEQNAPEPVKSDINKLYLKITGLPGRRRILPEE